MVKHTPLQIAEAHIQTNEFDEALRVLKDYLETKPQDDDARRLRIAVLMRMTDEALLRQALDEFDHLLRIQAGDYIHRSIVYERLDELDNAAQSLIQAHALNPGDGRLAERYLQLLADRGNVEEAKALVQRMPKTWQWLKWAAELEELVENSELAIENYDAALNDLDRQLDTINDPFARSIKAQTLLKRARVHWQLDHTAEADADYAAAAALGINDPMLTFYRGLVAAEHGEIDAALELCKEALTDAKPAERERMMTLLGRKTAYEPLVAALQESGG